MKKPRESISYRVHLRRTSAIVSLVAAGAVSVLTAAAQDDAGKNSTAVEAISVTATRRSAPLQKVPVAVAVVTAKQFTNSGFKRPTDLQYLSPSLQVSASGGVAFALRGVGNNSLNNATEQAVGVVVDGVTYGFVNDPTADLTGLQDIEILRGPQGTTFGKNSSAGVININLKRPSFDHFYADLHGTYGSYNDTNSYLNMNIPLSARLAAMVSVNYINRDGFSWNPVRHEMEGNANQIGYRAKFLYQPSDDLSFYLSSDFHQERAHPLFLSTYRSVGDLDGLGVLSYGIKPSPSNTETGATSDAAQLENIGGVSLQGDYHFGGGYTLTSISALRFLADHNSATLGATPIEFLNFATTDHGTQVSQEFRLLSPAQGFFQYVTGLYYYDRLTHTDSLSEGAFASGRSYSFNNTRTYAGFAEGTSHFTDQLSLVTGLRLTYDQASAHLYTTDVPDGGTAAAPSSVQSQDRNIAFRVGPQYNITPDLMTYFTMAQAYKAALAVPVQGGPILTVNPETVRSYEWGVKTSLFDRRLVIDGDLFYEHFKDFQTNVLDTLLSPPEFELGNAGGMTTKGLELDFTAKPIPALTLSGGLTYQEARYTNFLTSCYAGQTVTTNSSGVGGCYTPAGGTGFTQAAGDYIDNASKWNFTGQAAYYHDLTDKLGFDANANTMYRTAYYTDGYIPGTRIGGYAITNINLGVSDINDKWRVGLFVRNLFDRYFVAGIEPGIFDTGAFTNIMAPEAKRTVGVQLDYHFE